MGAATGTLASGLIGELVTAVGFPELGGCASHILFKGSVEIGKVRKTTQGGYLIDPVLLMDQAPLRLPDPAADNIVVDREGSVLSELPGKVIFAQVELVSDESEGQILRVIVINEGPDSVHHFAVFAGGTRLQLMTQYFQDNGQGSTDQSIYIHKIGKRNTDCTAKDIPEERGQEFPFFPGMKDRGVVADGECAGRFVSYLNILYDNTDLLDRISGVRVLGMADARIFDHDVACFEVV